MERERTLREITFSNLEHGEVTLYELNEIYEQLGFYFEVDRGQFKGMKKERVHWQPKLENWNNRKSVVKLKRFKIATDTEV